MSTQTLPMPVASLSSGLIMLAAALPLASIPAVIMRPGDPTVYALVGALLSGFLCVVEMRGKNVLKWTNVEVQATFILSFFVGWCGPPILAWTVVNTGALVIRLTQQQMDSLPMPAHAMAGLLCGMSGQMVIRKALSLIKKWLGKDAVPEYGPTTLMPIPGSDDSAIAMQRVKMSQVSGASSKPEKSDIPPTTPP